MTSPARIVLGCLLARPAWFADARVALGVLSEQAFELDKFDAAVWATLSDLSSRDVAITPLDVLAPVVAAGFTDGLAQIRTLVDLAAVETKETFERRLVALHDETYQRIARAGMQRLLQKADADPAFDWDASLAAAADGLRLRKRADRRYVPLTPRRVIESTEVEHRLIPTGFSGIDNAGGELIVGKMQTLLARTNAGKSTFMWALCRNQFAPGAAKNVELERENRPMLAHQIMDMRRLPGHASSTNNKPAAPYVLLLSVEDDIDDYLGRAIVDLADIHAQDYLRNKKKAIADREAEYAVNEVAALLGNGRLTIADYQVEDGRSKKTLAQIEETIGGWASITRSRCLDEGNPNPPLLVLLDYFQKIKNPDAEKMLRDERRVFAQNSDALYELAKRKQFALFMAVMSLRGQDNIEPDENDARGGSDVIQDADGAWTIWPFGARERAAIEAAAVDDHPASLDPTEDGEGIALGDVLSRTAARRAVSEMLITSGKGRHSATGWRVPLCFQRDYKRITNAYEPRKIWRDDPTIAKILTAARTVKGKK